MVYRYVRAEGEGLYALVLNGRAVGWTTDPDAAGRALAAILKKKQAEYVEEKRRQAQALAQDS